MRTNGLISFSISLIGSPCQQFDADGEPISLPDKWTEPTECYICDIMEDRKAKYIDGGYTDVSYEVICEGMIDNTVDRVRLTRRGRNLGEFNVQSIRETSVNRTIILV